jgi:hypothetical protein
MDVLAAVTGVWVSCFVPTSPCVPRCFRNLMSLEVWAQIS